MRWTDNSFAASGPVPDAWSFLARTPLSLRFGGSDPGFEHTTDTNIEHYIDNNWCEYVGGRITKVTMMGKSSIILGIKTKLIVGKKGEVIGGFNGKIIKNGQNANWKLTLGEDLPQEDAVYAKMDVVMGWTKKWHHGDKWEDTDQSWDATHHTGREYDIKEDYTRKFKKKCKYEIKKYTETVQKSAVERVKRLKTAITKNHTDRIDESVKEMNTYTTDVKKWYTGEEKCNKLNWTVKTDATITVDGLFSIEYGKQSIKMGGEIGIQLYAGTSCYTISKSEVGANKTCLDNNNLITSTS